MLVIHFFPEMLIQCISCYCVSQSLTLHQELYLSYWLTFTADVRSMTDNWQPVKYSVSVMNYYLWFEII